jgi:paraquat-inducible protein B
MSKKISKTAIGAFVLGAIALVVAGVLILGSGKFFSREYVYITYFAGSVKGLSVGSPVMFRGVKVGTVTDIGIVFDPEKLQLRIPVVFTLDPQKFKATKAEFHWAAESIKIAVDKGLRTQLQLQSFVTGQLMLSLDFFPDKPAVYVGWDKSNNYPEIPSIPTPLEELQRTLEALPLKKIVENLNDTLENLDKLVHSFNEKKSAETLVSTVRDIQTLVRNVNAKVDPLVASITRTSGAAEATLVETRATVVAVRGDLKELVTSSKSAIESAQAVLKQSEQTLQAYSPDSPLVTELHRTLRDLSSTSRSFRNLSDYLERHPESLLRGKTGDKGDLK